MSVPATEAHRVVNIRGVTYRLRRYPQAGDTGDDDEYVAEALTDVPSIGGAACRLISAISDEPLVVHATRTCISSRRCKPTASADERGHSRLHVLAQYAALLYQPILAKLLCMQAHLRSEMPPRATVPY